MPVHCANYSCIGHTLHSTSCLLPLVCFSSCSLRINPFNAKSVLPAINTKPVIPTIQVFNSSGAPASSCQSIITNSNNNARSQSSPSTNQDPHHATVTTSSTNPAAGEITSSPPESQPIPPPTPAVNNTSTVVVSRPLSENVYDPDYSDDDGGLANPQTARNVNNSSRSQPSVPVGEVRAGSRTPRVSIYSYRNSSSPSPDRLSSPSPIMNKKL